MPSSVLGNKNFGFYYINLYRLKKGQLLNKFSNILRPTILKKDQIFFGPQKCQSWQPLQEVLLGTRGLFVSVRPASLFIYIFFSPSHGHVVFLNNSRTIASEINSSCLCDRLNILTRHQHGSCMEEHATRFSRETLFIL